MKNFNKLLVAGGFAAVAFTACSMVDEYDQELVDRLEANEIAVRDSIEEAKKDSMQAVKDSIQKVDDATCDSVFIDPRDSVSYNLIRVYDAATDGGKAHCWFKENLKYENDDSECYEGEKGAAKKCKKYGRLYQGSKLAGVCPEGTHVATLADWQHLYKVQKIEKLGAAALKATEDDDWAMGDGPKATDVFGFSAVAGGAYDTDEEYYSVGEAGFWWLVSSDKMASFSIHRDDEDPTIQSKVSDIKNLYYSVRCVVGEGPDPSSKDDDDKGGSENDTPTQEEINEITKVTITGFAQKGPFVKGSKVTAYELENGSTLKQVGNPFTGTVEKDDGQFTVKDITLSSQFAMLSVEGYYKSEVTGEISSNTLVLNAYTDLTKRTKVNVNLLTHLEYDRLAYLVKEKGMRFTTAKETAESEVFKAFFIDSDDFAIAEDLDVNGTSDADIALQAISIMVLGGNTEGQVTDMLKSISTEIAKIGKFENDSIKARIADWLAEQDLNGKHFANVRKAVGGESGKLEEILANYWLRVYGMDTVSCTKADEGKIVWTENQSSKNYKDSRVRFICKDSQWTLASDLEKDTEGWKAAKNAGDVRNGSVNNDSVYVFEDGSWREGYSLDSTLKLRGCIAERDREVSKGADGKWYICDNKKWGLTSELKGPFAKYSPDDKLKFYNLDITNVELDTMIDSRDGQVYRIASITDSYNRKKLTWMIDNLNYNPKKDDPAYENAADGVQSWCYDGLDYNCMIAGRLYTWTAALNIAPEYQEKIVNAEFYIVNEEIGDYAEETGASDPVIYMFEKHQGICPDGWRLPDAYEVVTFIPDDRYTAAVTAYDDIWGASPGNNLAGYSFIPTGYRDGVESKFVMDGAYMWYSEVQVSLDEAEVLLLKGGAITMSYNVLKNTAASVRCVKAN
ncbi:MAG: hypothetical protein MJY98_07715 [Fibrobacter sp.]|nr:hypothetical protein [Fibrobacter sp.]